ncbi:LANO_0C04192g1_1 [Lachancea nothofagi CBS 11611]|uniref:25S rRNA adenine-N(1) methyltransferase n=1 Tax=Lachancea nothofagi CBS 11611 TaxID=1266666 RepID=A0A1G4J6L5_9SACH|nr:LANO_0C04192g1_1 [Lachancea nothofagi CBS 11611]
MLSRHRKTVTGNPVLKRRPTIKPVKARRIIRRFHLLINKRRIICAQLKLKLVENGEELNEKLIKKKIKSLNMEKDYDEGWNASHPDSVIENCMLKVQVLPSNKDLVRILGYIMSEILQKGGLQNYQLASTIGQDKNRGGDSSKVLVDWFRKIRDPNHRYRALEIGSLSAKNAISISGVFEPVVRIDLNSNDPAYIERQDFMDRPDPASDAERFDLISCSLVLNFVPTPQLRGAMLSRFQNFLRMDVKSTYVFLVLPLPCVSNSRYMSESRLCDIMSFLGYEKTHKHESYKIIYLLFERNTENTSVKLSNDAIEPGTAGALSKKQIVRDKPGMNNFSVLL